MRKKLSVCFSHVGGKVEIAHLSHKDVDTVLRSIDEGTVWIKGKKDKTGIMQVSAYKSLPKSVEDAEMLPFWRPVRKDFRPRQISIFEIPGVSGDEYQPESCSYYISSVCGYNYTPKNYQKNVRRLEKCGFECMRSQRGNDDKYWEVWYLPGTWAAKGELQLAIEASKEKTPEAIHSVVLDFLREYISFGSLDISVQRLAMAVTD